MELELICAEEDRKERDRKRDQVRLEETIPELIGVLIEAERLVHETMDGWPDAAFKNVFWYYERDTRAQRVVDLLEDYGFCVSRRGVYQKEMMKLMFDIGHMRERFEGILAKNEIILKKKEASPE